MGAPWNSGNGGVVAPRLGVLSMGQDGSGHTTQAPRSLPSGAYRDFWKEYANILVRFTVLHSMSYPYPRDGSETPVTNQMLEVSSFPPLAAKCDVLSTYNYSITLGKNRMPWSRPEWRGI